MRFAALRRVFLTAVISAAPLISAYAADSGTAVMVDSRAGSAVSTATSATVSSKRTSIPSTPSAAQLRQQPLEVLGHRCFDFYHGAPQRMRKP